jgi:hypothetical protein
MAGVAELELVPAIDGSVMQSAHVQRWSVKRRVSRQHERRGGVVAVAVKMVAALHHWLCTLCRSELGLSVGKSDSGEPRDMSRRHPHLFILCIVTGAH